MLERFMSLIPAIILASWVVFFVRSRKSGRFQQFLARYPFLRVLIGGWALVFGAGFLLVLAPKPAHFPLFVLRVFGLLMFVLAFTSMAYGLFWLYQEGIKPPGKYK